MMMPLLGSDRIVGATWRLAMSYSLWSRGRLLGHSALDYKRFIANHRAGTCFTSCGLTTPRFHDA